MDLVRQEWDKALLRLRNHLYARDVEPLRPRLLAHCLRLTGDRAAAEDLFQETLLRGLPAACRLYGAPENTKAFLWRVAANLWIDVKRRQRREKASLDRLVDRPALEDAPNGKDVETYLAMLSQALPPRELKVFLLREIHEYTGRETARMLGVSEAAVKMAVSRARKRLRAARDPIPSTRTS